jgi:GNAT superfamily N-acetyltransferase
MSKQERMSVGRTAMLGQASIEIHPVTPERWTDLERLFGPRGACAGCWCMWWRVQAADWSRQRGAGNRAALRSLVESKAVPGLLAYVDGKPAGWVSVGPREAFPRLERSRILKRVDDQPVWSVVCFFVAKSWRQQGVTEHLLGAAVAYAREHGATIVEGYPVEPRSAERPAVYAFTGLASAFRKAGFTEVARRSETRPIMRYTIGAEGGNPPAIA